jgi:hypothetical protein
MDVKTSKIAYCIIPTLLVVCLLSCTFAQSSQWTKVEIPDVCSFEIPGKMEIQGGSYKAFSDSFQQAYLKIPFSDKVVIQPKGINALDKEALKLYARVIIKTVATEAGEVETLTTPLDYSSSELRELDEVFKQGFLTESKKVFPSMQLLKWEPTRIETINGIDVIVKQYVRQWKQNVPVVVKEYVFNNYNRMHIVTMSYRQTEAGTWEALYPRILQSFRFQDRAPKDMNAKSIELVMGLLVSAIFTWVIGLTPPLVLRFVLLRHPLSKRASVIFCAIQLLCNEAIFISLGSESKTHFALVLVAYVSYHIIHKGWGNWVRDKDDNAGEK